MATIHIAFRETVASLIHHPDMVLQRLSLKLHEKREQHILKLKGQMVTFQTSGGTCVGKVVDADGTHASLSVDDRVLRVDLRKIKF